MFGVLPKKNMRVLVTGAGSRIGQAVIKLIKKFNKKHFIITTDYFKDSVGFYWTNNYELLPDILSCEIKVWLNALEKIITKYKVELIIPGVDFELPYFSKYKLYLESKYNLKCLISPEEQIGLFNDKYLTYKFLVDNNINAPKTFLLDEYKLHSKKIKFPVLIKPRVGSTSKGILQINNLNELKKLKLNSKKFIIQEKLNGFEVTSGAVIFNKKIYSLINLKRNLKNGNTHSASLYKNKTIDNYIKKIIKVANFYGPINFQLFIYKNKPNLIEINPRFSGTSFSRSLFGLNEYKIVYSVIFKKNLNPKFKIKTGSVIKYIEDLFINKDKLI